MSTANPRSILITGGTGFLGRAIVRHLLAADLDVARICVYSRGEVAQHHMREELERSSPPGWLVHERLRWFIGDVRDRDRLRRAMEGVDHVVHAAALKRVEVGEYNPSEMVRTNIDGTHNLIEAAIDAQVSRVVGISTDKACEPMNTYGVTKAAAERLLIGANELSGNRTRFSVVRYGNVAGSTGSVIPAWRAAMLEPREIIITDGRCTRFWMSVEEAVDLVMKVMRQGQGGQIVVPSLPAYELADLLTVMMGQDGWHQPRPQEIGLGHGEKLHETMISANEAPRFAKVGSYWIYNGVHAKHPIAPLDGPLTSANARRLTVNELRGRVKDILSVLP